MEMLGGESPDALLLDLLLPKMDGFRVLDHVRQKKPDLLARTIVVTAAGEEILGEHPELSEVSCFLRKPLDVDLLGQELLVCARRAAERKSPQRAAEATGGS